MIRIPETEREKFGAMLTKRAQEFGLTPEEFLRKIWYHETASRFGEYVALVLLEELLPLVPAIAPEHEEVVVTSK